MFFRKFGEKIKSLFGGRKIDEAFFEELEDTLIEGDLGARLTDEIVTKLREIAKKVDWLVSVFTDNAGVIKFNDKLDLEYVRKYKKFLSAKKIYDIQKAEMRFHRELLKSAHHGEKGRPRNKEKR